MLFNLYGDNAMWQLLGWVLVFAGLVICNEIARRTKAGGVFFFLILPCIDSLFYCHRSRRSKRRRVGIKQPDT